MKLIYALILLSIINTHSYANYCAAIRGNGELAPAHWASIGKISETHGLPESGAGGSSASITLFLLDAISRNHLIKDDSEKNAKHSLLIKSLMPHLLYLYEEDAKAPKVMQLVGNITGLGDGGFFHKLSSSLKIARDLPHFFKLMGEYGLLLNPTIAKGLRSNFSFYKSQVAEGIKVFGAFDAVNDKNLFYREGLLDFKYLGILFGRVADFYAGYGSNFTNKKLDKFLNNCAQDSLGKEWNNLIAQQPNCKSLLYSALDTYYGDNKYKKRHFPNRMIFEKVGSGLNVFPTTALVKDEGVTRYKELKRMYKKQKALDVPEYTIDFEQEMKYGYWGRSEDLAIIKDNLLKENPNDLKSQKFESLNGGIWFEVLGTSPAEPGLANLQYIPDGNKVKRSKILNKKYFKRRLLGLFKSLKAIDWFNEESLEDSVTPPRKNMISAGGWSDLHPTLVLKANQCENIIYVTRQGGESVFGQQIFIRLTGYSKIIRFWENIRSRNAQGWYGLNNEEEASPWNQLYNLANPSSSFNRSIKASSSVHCTDWDAFNLFKEGQIDLAMSDSYNTNLISPMQIDIIPGCTPFL